MRHSMTRFVLIMIICAFSISCSKIPNSPYPIEEMNDSNIYISYDTVPKTLDPAVSYSSNEAAIIGSMYEPPFMYHPFKRPYILIPDVVRNMPMPEYRKRVTIWSNVKPVKLGEYLSSEQKKVLEQIRTDVAENAKTLFSLSSKIPNELKSVVKSLTSVKEAYFVKHALKDKKNSLMRKQVDFIFDEYQKLADEFSKSEKKATDAELKSKTDTIYTTLYNNPIMKLSINEGQILSQVTDEAKKYWDYLGLETKILKIEDGSMTKNTLTPYKVVKVEQKQYNSNPVYFVSVKTDEKFDENVKFRGMSLNNEIVLLNYFNDAEELKKLGLTDETLKYFMVTEQMDITKAAAILESKKKDVTEKKVNEEIDDNKASVAELVFLHNSIQASYTKTWTLDVDEIGNAETQCSFKNYSNLGKFEDKGLVFSFSVWLPSTENECRELNDNRIVYQVLKDEQKLMVAQKIRNLLNLPYVFNTSEVRSIYTMRIMPGIYYQPHPCFSKDKKTGAYLFHEGKKPFIKTTIQEDGSKLYSIKQSGKDVEITEKQKTLLEGSPINAENLSNVYDLDAFQKYFPEYDPTKSTRELTAADYVYQLKRMLNPQAPIQIANTIFNYLNNTYNYYKHLKSFVLNLRKTRRSDKGIAYSQEVDEEENPIKLDYEDMAYEGAEIVDRYTYKFILSQPYPQFKYWLAMPFFAPMPWEADMFFLQGPMQKNTLTLSKFPVGTGAYRMWKYQRQSEISSIKNENFNRLGPDNGTKPPIFQESPKGSNMLMATMPLGVADDYLTAGTGIDKNKNGKLDGSLDIRDYLVKNDYAELPFFDENNNGIYDGIRYWDDNERFARFDYAENFIDFNENDAFDEGIDRKVSFAEGVYFEDLNLNGIYEPEINEKWYKFPATYRTTYPYAGQKNSCPLKYINNLVSMQKKARDLWIDRTKNRDQLRKLDEEIATELINVMEEYNYTQDQIGDEAVGILRDAGRRLPFMKAIIRRREKEATSYWSKFIQGYYELSGVGEDKFDKFIDMSPKGAYLSENLKKEGIQLRRAVPTSIWYFAFNMQNPTWGWSENYEDEKPDLKKALIRQACSIALNFEEFNDTFTNGRNMANHMILPPGIYGYEEAKDQTFFENLADLEYYYNEDILKGDGDKRLKISEMTDEEIAEWSEKYAIIFNRFADLPEPEQDLAKMQKFERNKAAYLKQNINAENVEFNDDDMIAEVHFGLNWAVYKWDKSSDTVVRRDLSYAKKLLENAGYPNGKDKAGNQLSMVFLTMGTTPEYLDIISWRKRKLNTIGVDMNVTAVEYNKFQEIALSGGYQCLEWGWNADYPDPENFFFLLYGPGAKCASSSLKKLSQGGGENAANYWNDEFDKLFKQMSTMSDTPERLRIIRKMNQMLRRDIPWIYSNLNVSYVLFHKWYQNSKTNLMGNNSYWFRRIDADVRAEYRLERNKPLWWPVIIFFALLIVILIPGIIARARRESKQTGKIDT